MSAKDPNLLFSVFLKISLPFECFPFFPKDLGGSASISNPCFFSGFPCCFPKRQGKQDQGSANASPRKSAKERPKERKRALPCKNYKETTLFGNSQLKSVPDCHILFGNLAIPLLLSGLVCKEAQEHDSGIVAGAAPVSVVASCRRFVRV